MLTTLVLFLRLMQGGSNPALQTRNYPHQLKCSTRAVSGSPKFAPARSRDGRRPRSAIPCELDARTALSMFWVGSATDVGYHVGVPLKVSSSETVS